MRSTKNHTLWLRLLTSALLLIAIMQPALAHGQLTELFAFQYNAATTSNFPNGGESHGVGTTAVKFNGTSAPTFVVDASGFITITVPAGATSGLITVTNAGGSTTSKTRFTVLP